MTKWITVLILKNQIKNILRSFKKGKQNTNQYVLMNEKITIFLE